MMLTEKVLRKIVREESKKLRKSSKENAVQAMAAALATFASGAPGEDSSVSWNVGKTMIAARDAGVTYEEALDILDDSPLDEDDKSQFQELVSSTFS